MSGPRILLLLVTIAALGACGGPAGNAADPAPAAGESPTSIGDVTTTADHPAEEPGTTDPSGGEEPAPEDPPVATLPAGLPTFTAPLDFTNPWFPFEPDAVEVFRGTEDGVELTVVRTHLPVTRTFVWNGAEIDCRVSRETEFRDGVRIAEALEFHAQADDGSVRFFGEIAREFEDGEVVSTEGSWVVGDPAAHDPEGTVSAAEPGLEMPADPRPGDAWYRESLPDAGIVEYRRVIRARKPIDVPGVKTPDGREIEERDDEGEIESKDVAPGVGVAEVRGADETRKLVATSLRPR